MLFGCFASSGTSPVAELADRDASAITGDAFRRLSAPTLPAPVQQSPVGDALPAFVGARRTSLHQRGSIAPAREHDVRGKGGGFAPIEASYRRIVGVSWLYWCNSPRLVAVRSRFGMVRSRFGAAWRPKCRPPRRQTPTMGCRGQGGLCCGHNAAWRRVELHANR